jgi:hypothetical protein
MSELGIFIGLPIAPVSALEYAVVLNTHACANELRHAGYTPTITRGKWPTREPFMAKTDRLRDEIWRAYNDNGKRPVPFVGISAGALGLLTTIFDPNYKEEMLKYVGPIATIAGPINEFRKGPNKEIPEDMKPLVERMKKWYPNLFDIYTYYLDTVLRAMTLEDKRRISLNLYGATDDKVPFIMSALPDVADDIFPIYPEPKGSHHNNIRNGLRSPALRRVLSIGK